MSFIHNLKKSFISALKPTWKSASWLLKLMIVITLTVNMLQYYGVIEWLATYLNPIFSFLGLPGSGALIFLSGAAAGTYSGLAAMMSVELTMRQATILGIMILLCHALPMECSVNKKVGSSFLKMGFIRVVAAFLSALLLNFVLPEMPEAFVYMGAAGASSLGEVLRIWAVSQLKMAVIVALIIYILMVIQRLLEEYGLIVVLSRFLSPLMTILGLPSNVAYMWLVGNVIGISYGSAVMLELKERGLITSRDANDVNYHLIMNHSMLEDTIVFALAGISVLWILSVRILFAFVLVWGRKLLVFKFL